MSASTTARVRAGLLAALATAVVAAVPAATPEPASACTTAKVQGATKCLQKGQFCKPAAQRDYRRAGFVCKRDRKGYNRLQYR